MALRETVLYREASTQDSSTTVLTRGSNVRSPQMDLRGRQIDVQVGRFWVADLPDLTQNNEAYLEMNLITRSGNIELPHPFKLEIDIQDNSFSANISGVEVVTGAQVIGTGVEFHCRLTELDKIDKNKFELMKNFVNNNDIPGVASALITSAIPGLNPKEAVKILFNAVEVLDGLNDDDRVWLERPKLDLRLGANNPLYEGWYALLGTPRQGLSKLPLDLYLSGGYLYESYDSPADNKPFAEESYLSWRILGSVTDPTFVARNLMDMHLDMSKQPMSRALSDARAQKRPRKAR